MKGELIDTVACQCLLGEGITWDPRLGAFLWTDIEGKALHSYALDTGDYRVVPLAKRLCSFALTDVPGQLFAAFDDCIATLNTVTGTISHLVFRLEHPGVRFNDGKTDPNGEFWVGTMVENARAAGRPDAGTLFRIDPCNTLHTMATGIAISNGLAWSPDGAAVFFADSARQTIWRNAAIENTLNLQPSKIFASATGNAHPDGATVSADGRYWSAQWGASRIAVYSSDGHLGDEITLPVTQPSCCAFGGPNLDILAVTTARVDLTDAALAKQPAAGNVFLFKTDATGLLPVPIGGGPLSGDATG